ncbi:hypothetical protein AB0D50_34940, partial [Streptomyces sp. NPDC048309]
MGNRPAEVDALLTSVAKQDVAPARIVIVGNGCPLPEFAARLGLPGQVTTIEVDENLGCPGGRNVALQRLSELADVDVGGGVGGRGLRARGARGGAPPGGTRAGVRRGPRPG